MEIQNDIYSQQIKEIRKLFFDFEILKCKERSEEILTMNPNHVEVKSIYGYILQYFDLLKSTQILEEIYAKDSSNFENTYYMLDNLNRNFINRGREKIKEIQLTFQEFKETNLNGYYYLALAKSQELLKNNELAIQTLEQNLSEYSADQQILSFMYLQLGLLYQNDSSYQDEEETCKSFSKAIEYFNQSLSIQNRNCLTLTSLGDQYSLNNSNKYLAKSIEMYKKSLQIVPYCANNNCNLAGIYLYQLQYKQGFDILIKDIENSYHFYQLHSFLEILNQQYFQISPTLEGDFQFIIKIFKKSINIEANNQFIFRSIPLFMKLLANKSKIFSSLSFIESIFEYYRIRDPMSIIILKNYFLYDYDFSSNLHPMIRRVFIHEQVEILSQMLFFAAYKKQVENQLLFQNQLQHTDLYY